MSQGVVWVGCLPKTAWPPTYSGVRESGPRKRDEDGDDDGDVDEDNHREDGSPSGASAPPRERGESLPLVLSPPWPPPRWGEVLPLVLGLHGDDGPSGILLHGLR